MKKLYCYIADILLIIFLITIFIIVDSNASMKMSPTMTQISTVIFAVLFALFISFFWRDKPKDEREETHLLFAGRMSFVVGTTVLAIGIIVQSINDTLDIWLPAALTAMIATKTLSIIYAQIKK